MPGTLRRPQGPLFASLNLRCNPFGTIPLEDYARLVVADLSDLPQRLGRPGLAVQFLGPSGRGKTSHLLACRLAHEGRPLTRIRPGEPVPPIPGGSPLFIDDAHLLPARRWRRLLARPGLSLALTTHVDLTPSLSAAGYRIVTVRPAELASTQRLAAIVRRRIEAQRRGPGPLPQVPAALLDDLQARFGTDYRAIEDELYLYFQALEARALRGAQGSSLPPRSCHGHVHPLC